MGLRAKPMISLTRKICHFLSTLATGTPSARSISCTVEMRTCARKFSHSHYLFALFFAYRRTHTLLLIPAVFVFERTPTAKCVTA